MAKNKNFEDFSYIPASNQSDNQDNQNNQDSKNNQKLDSRLQKYEDPSGVSWRQLNIGLWIAENKRNITRVITILLILISAFFFIYSSYAYIIYFLSGPIDNQPENQVLSPRNIINEMSIGSLEIFRNPDSYDLVIELQNNNDNFSAEFNYCFYQGEHTLKCEKGHVLPSERKYILALGINLADSKAVAFKINDIFWARVNRREIADWETFFNDRINFETTNMEFLNSSRSGLSDNVSLNTLEFDYTNHSPYSYFSVPLNILFYNGSSLVAVESYTAKDFLTGETRSIKMTWPGDIGTINRIEVVPDINILDDSVYLKYGG
ncbi:MAG: hypothetical protein ACOX0H_01770 [Patescibacteria group bacterium]|jgi:hypothetical protein|nr:hypothetical protein [bacterium]HQC50124.1 hypothetical protein [bacterium]